MKQGETRKIINISAFLQRWQQVFSKIWQPANICSYLHDYNFHISIWQKCAMCIKWKCIFAEILLHLLYQSQMQSWNVCNLLDGKYGIRNKTWGAFDGMCSIGNKRQKISYFTDYIMANICLHLRIIIWQNQHQLHQRQRQTVIWRGAC